MKKKVLLSSVLAAGFMVSGTVHAAEPDNNTVDGTATYVSVGEIVPSDIEFTGYDVRNGKMYLNVTIASSDGSANIPENLPYTIDVFNNVTSQSLLNVPYTNSLNSTGATVASVTDSDIELTLDSPLDKYYRINVEVDKD